MGHNGEMHTTKSSKLIDFHGKCLTDYDECPHSLFEGGELVEMSRLETHIHRNRGRTAATCVPSMTDNFAPWKSFILPDPVYCDS